jgi:hypothetical protein
MRVFYGAAIQGAQDREKRAHVHEFIIDTIKKQGFDVYTEHTTGRTYEEAIEKLEQSIGKLPEMGIERRISIRNKMIEGIESDIVAAVFEVSIPSLGTGVEIAHAYLRPRMGLMEIPILVLYEKDYWPNKLSTMIRGISCEELPNFQLVDYNHIDDVEYLINKFFMKILKTERKTI